MDKIQAAFSHELAAYQSKAEKNSTNEVEERAHAYDKQSYLQIIDRLSRAQDDCISEKTELKKEIIELKTALDKAIKKK